MARKVKERKCPVCGEVSKTQGIPSFTVVSGDYRNPKDTDKFMCNTCGAVSTRKVVHDYNA